jgi:hypothetical protein
VENVKKRQKQGVNLIKIAVVKRDEKQAIDSSTS